MRSTKNIADQAPVVGPVDVGWLNDGEIEPMVVSDPVSWVRDQFKTLVEITAQTRQEERCKIAFLHEDVLVDLICHKSDFGAVYYLGKGRKSHRDRFRNIDDAAESVVLRALGVDPSATSC
jgi:hypothetical protein